MQQEIDDLRARIAVAAEEAGRKADSVCLVAVSKKQPDERVDEVLRLGLRIFGENRVQEALERWEERRLAYPDLELRLIGSLQTNKVAEAVSLFDVIEVVDREKLAKALAEEMKKQGRFLPCFIQVNTGEEEQKSGISPKDAVDFCNYCQGDLGLDIRGLMCIPPLDEEAAMHFALLKTLADKASLKELSMGMSEDFTEAIQFGATHVRVGTALFGERIP